MITPISGILDICMQGEDAIGRLSGQLLTSFVPISGHNTHENGLVVGEQFLAMAALRTAMDRVRETVGKLRTPE